MDPLTSLELAELRLQELRADATSARLAAEARRSRRPRSRFGWLRRIARRRPRAVRIPSPVPSMAQR